ncbi:MAG TPA: hypothetical protein VF498_07700, partial [Anaerolineales bacterium]
YTQPASTLRFLEGQASVLASALLQRQAQVRFLLPDRVQAEPSTGGRDGFLKVAPEHREQLAGGLRSRLARANLSDLLHQRLVELEQTSDLAVAFGARLVRHSTALHLVYNLLPAGHSVLYVAQAGEEIPSIPAGRERGQKSALLAKTDAVAEEQDEDGFEELLAPYVPAARRFYLPQWVAFDDQGNLLVNSANEAESYLASMQRFMHILNTASSLAPYMVADDTYHQKRFGMLGQLVNQGRCLALYETGEIIDIIRRRAAARDLNRGLSVSLPYFDDQDLEVKIRHFEITPPARILFVPAFVERAAREEQVKVLQDTRLNPSTRSHLMVELRALEHAFQDHSGGI